MATSHQLMPLHILPAGRSARIAELLGDAAQRHRLEEMGLRPGTLVKMVSPGTPCIVHLDGSRFCFRHSDALGVLVSLEDAA